MFENLCINSMKLPLSSNECANIFNILDNKQNGNISISNIVKSFNNPEYIENYKDNQNDKVLKLLKAEAKIVQLENKLKNIENNTSDK